VVIEIKNIRGEVIGSETVVADAGGNWLAKFAGNTIYDTPTSVVQKVTAPNYSQPEGNDESLNFRTYFSPAVNPSHFFSQPFDVDAVFSENEASQAPTSKEASQAPLDYDWKTFNYEFLSQPGIPSK
jgi:hypothetical protein